MPVLTPQPRYSGHETFVCRYAWLPKVVRQLAGKRQRPDLFKHEHDAIVRLGVGKNMVRSARFWAESAQVIELCDGGHRVTPFGQRLLGHDGHDPFLERPETLWLLHWKIATNPDQPIFYWRQMLNFWHRPEFSLSEALEFLKRELRNLPKPPSDTTLDAGLRVFVNTYVPTRGKKGEVAEDNLDSPLVELGLIRPTGERATTDQGSREPIYSFNLDDKRTVTDALFAYCLDDFWRHRHPEEQTLPFRFASVAAGSPGQVFKLPELAVRARLEALSSATGGALEFLESSALPQVQRTREVSEDDLLDAIYDLP